MAKTKKRKLFSLKRTPKEKKYRKIYIYVIVVNFGFKQPVLDILQNNESNVQYTVMGRGTASSELVRLLGLEGNKKDVIFAMTDIDNIKFIADDLNKHFAKEKRAMGVGFAIPLTSIVGEKIYSFITNTL